MWTTAILVAIGFITDFIISTGGCLTTAMVATKEVVMPAPAVILFSAATGLVAAARGVRAILDKGLATTTTTETDTAGTVRSVTMTAPRGAAAPAPVSIPAPDSGAKR